MWRDFCAAEASSRSRLITLDASLTNAADHGWDHVVGALRAILDGARDAEALVDAHDLDREDYLIVLRALEAVEGKAITSSDAAAPPAERGRPARMEVAVAGVVGRRG